MEFLYSNLPPIRTGCPAFADTFYSLMQNAARMDIAVAYVTADSIAQLKKTLEYNDNIKTLNLIIGMHYWDKFTKNEYNAAVSLNEYLLGEQRGEVRLVTPFRFHGKLYSYSNSEGAFAGIIGSDNLGSIVESRMRIYEASVLLREREYVASMRDFIEKLSQKAAQNLDECDISDFKERGTLLEGLENVENVRPDQLAVLSFLHDVQFEIPLVKNGNVPEHSNLNVFFGKGREVAGSGVVQPRHWYEAELIVPNTVTTLPGYPQKDTDTAVFDVITDDGWKFSCKVSGDYSKNLRSEDDLKILGRWIKGRLENAGVLQAGELITPETFEKYGRDTLTMTKTTAPNLWYLDFGVR